MHLLGNLFFLIICGFAVEAAIGHLRFLAYYLISGAVGGLMFAAMDFSSPQPLIGASGAISGVMAMYLGVFRFKKIEFFYWLFVFVGYFRAPALLILPLYIGKEVYAYYHDVGANVAFMAHTGGFIAGGVLIALTYFIKPEVFNEEYIEEDQDLPQVQQDLAKVYENISRSKLISAANGIEGVIKTHGLNFDWAYLRYNLYRMLQSPKALQSFDSLLQMKRLNAFQLNKLVHIWNTDKNIQSQLSMDDLYKLGWILTDKNHVKEAENIFKRLNDFQVKHPNLGMYAMKLSVVFGKLENQDKKKDYELIATQLIEGQA
jgi:tetratricopeptide (TPR) repeat protein